MRTIDFYESFNFAFATAPASAAQVEISDWTAEEITQEIEQIKKCASFDVYRRVSRSWSKHRMDVYSKRAFWRVVMEGWRW